MRGAEVVHTDVGRLGSARAIKGVERRGEQALAAFHYLSQRQLASVYFRLERVAVQDAAFAYRSVCLGRRGGLGGSGAGYGQQGEDTERRGCGNRRDRSTHFGDLAHLDASFT